MEVVYPQGEAAGEGAPSAPAKYRTLFGAALNEKPEHMTHLKGNVLVFKDHPRIAFRGWIDALEAEILLTQQAAAGEGYGALAGGAGGGSGLCPALYPLRRAGRAGGGHRAVRLYAGAAPGVLPLSGEALRPAPLSGLLYRRTRPAGGQQLRTVVRQTELAAYAAFRDADGNVTRGDMILGLNRLSSLMWIFMIKLKAGRYERK